MDVGVWQAPPNQVGDAVTAALKAGYRHIDDAWAYHVSFRDFRLFDVASISKVLMLMLVRY